MRVAACEMEHMPRFCVIYREVIPTSKIEKPQAIKKMDQILKVSNGLMVDRGDLGIEIPAEEVPLCQTE